MSAMAFGFLASALAERGEFGDAGSVAAEALRRAEAHEPRYSAVFGAWSVGYVSVRRGDLAGATRVLRPALDHCRATGLPIVFPAVASMLGLAYALAGRHAEGIPLLEEAYRNDGGPGKEPFRAAWLLILLRIDHPRSRKFFEEESPAIAEPDLRGEVEGYLARQARRR